MPDPSPTELELTPDLLDYARRVGFEAAKDHCKPGVCHDDVVQEALLHLIAKPPVWDPARGASPKTLIYLVVQTAVLKHAEREERALRKFKTLRVAADTGHNASDGVYDDPVGREIASNRTVGLSQSSWATDDVLEYIDDENSRTLCRTIMECEGNVSEAARRLKMKESTIRYRLKLLIPKLLAKGFKVVSEGEFHERKHGQG
ncbi:MAG: sigma-70 family RNA polymerase sigma factor [Phycisphaeraceae bacterium]|nr:MAG: sigma-70 family RNA polymerase sigma factor [Phycisphaeraceae bacterium]